MGKRKPRSVTLPFKITPQMQALIEENNPQDPIALQFLPSAAEENIVAAEKIDPIGDQQFSPVKGIIHRYPDRCLLLPLQVCALYCRFCFRKNTVGNGEHSLSAMELSAAYDYIRAHPEIWEVILTGGDPLILHVSQLKKILENLNSIPHIEVLRIHTRIPFVASKKITDELISLLQCDKTVYVAVHANHPKEFTSEAIRACAKLVDAGIPLLSQTVLLKGINDDINTLSELMRCFVKHRIKPYYLHHADLAQGTQHFRTSIAHGQQLMRELRGRFSGLCQPTYVLDIPGGHGKSPIGPNYLQCCDEQLQVEDYEGKTHVYLSI